MTPIQFAQKYQKLSVYIIDPSAPADTDSSGKPPGEWVENVNVSSYRLGESGEGLVGEVSPAGIATYKTKYKDALTRSFRSYADGKNSKGKPADEGITVVVKTVNGTEYVRRHTYNELAYSSVMPYYGKGSPEEVQLALQLRYRFQAKKGKLAYDLASFVKLKFIGLDCNGFVGNYIHRISRNNTTWLQQKNLGAGNGISQIMDSLDYRGQKILTLDDVMKNPAATFVMALCTEKGHVGDRIPNKHGQMGAGHILITEPGTMTRTGDVLNFCVIESAGGVGLTIREGRISAFDKRTGIFQVERGGQPGIPMRIAMLR